jgi:hypothetical protein
MITNKIIQQETEELKQILKQGDLEIPSMWTCLWPSLIIIMWMEVCATINFIISTSHSNLGSLRLFPFVFCFFMGVILGVGVANGRGVFLSVPKLYRKQSETYAFFRLKLKKYFYFFVFMTAVVSVVSGVLGFPEIVFTVLLIFLVVIMGMVMNVDFSRYQLSLLTSTIEVFKGDKKDG